ncbi:hypothetical protein [Pedobacter sp. Hv1]|uniref:hypothetical protein n=1 Tax=Pedobacter sp. Hv1 TaxID=1740090 RepID=UPI0006D8D373|nr:hypothetical protein [Pedobacter sp. Hv1]KQC02138.1 hypothetical protein AQF98_00765 [Pedobacter sp. Hv1]
MLKKSIFSGLIIIVLATAPLHAQDSFFNRFKPDEVNIQYAGSIGFLSAGAGYHFFKKKTTLSFHVGYVPENLGGEMTILAVKFEYKPFAIKIKDKIIIHPINPTFFPSYTLGQNFDFKFEKPQYRRGYYFWSSALRLHLAFGTEVKLLTNKKSKIKALSLYAEANTNDLYMISWFKNRELAAFRDIFKMGYGVKMYF